MGAAAAVLFDGKPAGEGSLWYGAEIDGDRLAGIIGHEADSIYRLCGVFALHAIFFLSWNSIPVFMRRVRLEGCRPRKPDRRNPSMSGEVEIAAVRATDFGRRYGQAVAHFRSKLEMAAHLAGSLTENRIHPTARIHDGAEVVGIRDLGKNSVIGNRVVAIREHHCR